MPFLPFNFTRNNEARLLPLACGLLYFAFSAPANLFAYSSRIGEMPAYSTISHALSSPSLQEASVTVARAQDATGVCAAQVDNVQNFLPQRNLQMGQENKMNIGLAGIFIEVEDANPAACNLNDKRRLLAESKRVALTINKLIIMLQQDHLEAIFQLQWLHFSEDNLDIVLYIRPTDELVQARNQPKDLLYAFHRFPYL